MRFPSLCVAVAIAAVCAPGAAAWGQRHNGGSSPPTAPPVKPPVVVAPIVAVSSGMGGLQFTTMNYAVSAPQALTRQLQSSDERIRTAGLAAVGAPAQYMTHGRVAIPHAVHLDFVALGDTDELDAVLTVELEQHVVSAIMVPENEEWHRVATMIASAPFGGGTTTPSTFLRTDRSLLEPTRYTAIFHAVVAGANGDFTENEAHVRIAGGRAVVTLSFTSGERLCDAAQVRPCEVIERWLQADRSDAEHKFLLVTATGRVRTNDAGDPIGTAETYETAHLRTFSCQPFVYSESTMHFEPSGAVTPCIVPPATVPGAQAAGQATGARAAVPPHQK